jgi:hypothetical protein
VSVDAGLLFANILTKLSHIPLNGIWLWVYKYKWLLIKDLWFAILVKNPIY